MFRLGIIIGVAFIFIVAAWGVSRWGQFRWTNATRNLHARLEAAREAPAAAVFDARELEGLPLPVQRYFRLALTDGQPVITAATVAHTGSFNMSASAPQWRPFTSTQRVVMRRPGFVWNARIAAIPGLPVLVHDAYVGGEGLLHATIGGLYPVADLRGTGDVAVGELMRYLAEAAWYPTALLPSHGVHWQAVDEHSARATLADGGVSVSLLFRFGGDGMIASILAEARGRAVHGEVVMTPWEGVWSGYCRRDGMRIPTVGEVAWLLSEGRAAYWRGTIASLEYEFANAGVARVDEIDPAGGSGRLRSNASPGSTS